MERVIILGGSGMLGHKLAQVFVGRFETWTTVRRVGALAQVPGLAEAKIVEGIDAFRLDALEALFADARPTVVVNCIGVVKQLAAAKDPVGCISINSLFPHQVAALAQKCGARFIHISTDCVFSGKKGGYVETDVADADDLYGRSKLLGEVLAPGALTLRTSIIGRELGTAHGLVEWFLAQEGRKAKGYTQAIFSGLPTVVLGRALVRIIEEHRSLSGLHHLSAAPIDKFSLLKLLREAYHCEVELEPDSGVRIDRSLDSSLLRGKTGIDFPAWPELVLAMAKE